MLIAKLIFGRKNTFYSSVKTSITCRQTLRYYLVLFFNLRIQSSGVIVPVSKPPNGLLSLTASGQFIEMTDNVTNNGQWWIQGKESRVPLHLLHLWVVLLHV